MQIAELPIDVREMAFAGAERCFRAAGRDLGVVGPQLDSKRLPVGVTDGHVETQRIEAAKENDGGRNRPPLISVEQAAKLLDAGPTTVKEAKAVLAHGTKEEIEAVEKGEEEAASVGRTVYRLGELLLYNKKTEREPAMRQFMMTVTALAAFGAMVATAQAAQSRPGALRSISLFGLGYRC
jgi:hypothetical protein